MIAREIVAALGGRWHGSYGLAPCPCHDDGSTPALKVSDAGQKSGGVDVHCFAGCDWQSVKSALRQAHLIPDEPWPGEAVWTAPVDPGKIRVDAERRQRSIALAREFWRASENAAGTLTARYLLSRGIEIVPPSIRHHPNLRHSGTGLYLPAMVACVQAVDGQFVALHRTFLSPAGKGKAAVSEPKMMLGPCSGGAVRLAPIQAELLLGEGVETTLAVMQATGLPGWACLSTSGLQSVHFPEAVKGVVILEDNDDPGRRAAATLADRLTREGRKVRIARPPEGLKDFNDVLLICAA
jgi:putative DNA primase/helicase